MCRIRTFLTSIIFLQTETYSIIIVFYNQKRFHRSGWWNDPVDKKKCMQHYLNAPSTTLRHIWESFLYTLASGFYGDWWFQFNSMRNKWASKQRQREEAAVEELWATVSVAPQLASLQNKMLLTSPWCPHYCLSAPEPAGNLLTFQGNVELGAEESVVGVMQHVRGEEEKTGMR